MFTIVSPEDTHPPTIIRYANFKRVCYEQMGEDGLSVLDTYISSIDELVDYYINQSSSVLLNCQQVSLLNRVTRTFQKATLWAIMRNRKIEIIDYLNALLRKMSKLSIQKKDRNIDFLFPNEITRKLSCYLIVTEVITLETTSDLLQIVIENNLLSKEDVFAIINNCIKILEIDISSRELIHS